MENLRFKVGDKVLTFEGDEGTVTVVHREAPHIMYNYSVKLESSGAWFDYWDDELEPIS